MCRHLGYLGPPVSVGEMFTRGTHSLRTQAWAPRDMRGGGTVNADGFGVAWWRHVPTVPGAASETPGLAPPQQRGSVGVEAPGANGAEHAGALAAGGDATIASRYRNPAPIWTDPAVDEVLPQLESWAVLASIRSATVGMPIDRSACAPFTEGRWAFSHNGVVQDWRQVLTAVVADLDTAATQFGTRLFDTIELLDAEAATDAATLWVLLRRLLQSTAPGEFVESPGGALGLLVSTVLVHAPQARLNLLLGDGKQLWATTVQHSLSALVTHSIAVLSSEPYDDNERWRPIDDSCVVTARPGHLSIDPLPAPTSKGQSR